MKPIYSTELESQNFFVQKFKMAALNNHAFLDGS